MLYVTFNRLTAVSLSRAMSFGREAYIPLEDLVNDQVLFPDEQLRLRLVQAASLQDEREREVHEHTPPMHHVGEICVLPVQLHCGVLQEQLKESASAWRVQESLTRLIRQLQAGQPIQIWYGRSAQEICALYWLCDQLRQVQPYQSLATLEAPELDFLHDGRVQKASSWLYIPAEDYHKYEDRVELLEPEGRQMLADRWRQLVQENGEMRRLDAEGHLITVDPEVLCQQILQVLSSRTGSPVTEMDIAVELVSRDPGLDQDLIIYCISRLIRQARVYETEENSLPGQRRLIRRTPRFS